MEPPVWLYDTTLRDGTQGEQITFSAEEKIRIAQRLDDIGIHYIEGGWPGSNPKDARFFKLAQTTPLKRAKLTAFGSTRRPEIAVESDDNIKALLESETETITIFGKSWDLHVLEIFETSLDENLKMIDETVKYLRSQGREVVYDAEHYFDGYKRNPEYALRTIQVAADAGAALVVLCDTNGGSMPGEIIEGVSAAKSAVPTPLGIHAHNDCGMAVANSVIAVGAGATMIQGTINGYGERCGNADLITLIANLQLKMKRRCVPDESLKGLTELSRYVSEVANVPPFDQRPYVGKSSFAHKGGVHVSAIIKNRAAYEHIEPGLVGNGRRILMSDLSGKGNVLYKAQRMNIPMDLTQKEVRKIVNGIKKLEDYGYQYDAAEGSFELLAKKLTNRFDEPFTLKTLRVNMEKNEDSQPICQVTIKIAVGDREEITAAEGDGPVNAMDNAIRKALLPFYPEIADMSLVDFKVRVIEGTKGTAARVRVLIESRDQKTVWGTVGVSENVLEASWQALVDSLQYKLSLTKNGK